MTYDNFRKFVAKTTDLEAPKYLLQRRFLIESVAFVVAFSLLFLLTYHPFSTTMWLGLGPDVVLPSVLFYLSGVGVLVLSKIALMLYQIRHTVSVRVYLLWFLGEFLLIGLIYLLFTRQWLQADIPFTFRLVLRTSLCVGMILVIPYTIFTLLAANKAKTEELDALKLQLATRSPQSGPGHVIDFYDFSGVLRISIPEEAILFIASQDNYVEIQYVLADKLLKYLMRCRTTRLEKQLEGSSLVRCHRSYIVNVDNVSQFKRENARAFLVLSHPEAKKIPVSKSYYKTIADRLGRIS